jgi:peptide-methionine (S)-S-oxide reductase
MFYKRQKAEMPEAESALPGRSEKIAVPQNHFVNGNSITGPFPQEMKMALFGLGCFWGAERKFWQSLDIFSTSVGYAGGITPNPSYEEVCSGMTGHNEVVRIVYDPLRVSYKQLLTLFWESHNPTQGMQQGNDVGTQYRSGIYTYNEEQETAAMSSRDEYQKALSSAGYDAITTEIVLLPKYYYAEHYHQQYLAKVPDGYCGLGGTGVSCPSDLIES